MHEEKRESNAILWKIINETIRNENVKKIEVIFENKNYSRSSQSKNSTLSRFVYFENDDKISFKKNEMFENFLCKDFSNQWKNRKFRSVELVKNLCFSATNEIIEFCSNNFQIKHCLRYCKTCSISEKFRFESSCNRKSNDCLFEWH